MTLDDLGGWRGAFDAFVARFSEVFKRSEPREQAAKYVRGLVTPIERKNGWRLAEVVGDGTPDRMQRLLYRAVWDVDKARDIVRSFVAEALGHPDGTFVLDETGFLKKGNRSVGVKRQYSGTAGKVENCQVATFLTYVGPRGHAMLDRRLYLPHEWCTDAERRHRAQVPEGVIFRTKPEQAVEMLTAACQAGVLGRWVTGDSVYGDATAVRDAVRTAGKEYVLAVSTTCPVWDTRPALKPLPTSTGRGRPATRRALAADAPSLTTAAVVVGAWPAGRWQRLSVGPGEKGPREYDWAVGRVVESREGLPGPDAWLLARRSVSDPTELAYYLSSAPEDTPVGTLAGVAGNRYTVEQCFEEGKGKTGLDHYEVRTWPSWHRHITLSMMALAWLAVMRAQSTHGEERPPGMGEAAVTSGHASDAEYP